MIQAWWDNNVGSTIEHVFMDKAQYKINYYYYYNANYIHNKELPNKILVTYLKFVAKYV